MADEFEAALQPHQRGRRGGGVAAGIHTPAGADAARRLAEGFTFASVAADLVHLERAAQSHLAAAAGATA